LTVAEAAKHCCVSESIVRGWLKDGLAHFRVGAKGRRGKILIELVDLDGWMALFKVTKKEPELRKAPAPPAPKLSLRHLRLPSS